MFLNIFKREYIFTKSGATVIGYLTRGGSGMVWVNVPLLGSSQVSPVHLQRFLKEQNIVIDPLDSHSTAIFAECVKES